MIRHGNCGCLTHSCCPRTRVLVSWSKTSVQPHVEVWDSCRLTNLLRLIHELPSLGFPFGISIENILKWDGGRGAYIQDVAGVKDAWWHWTGSRAHNEWFRIRERPISRWLTKTFWCGSWNRSTWGKGCRRSPLRQRLTEWRYVANGDDRHVWVKLCTPAGLNLFKKPCPQLWTTWRQILDHRQLEPNLKSANLRVRL
jgi:hypothetical protein